jgi:hypothetical protein
VPRLSAASVAASSHRRRVGKKTIAGNKLYEPSAANKVAGGISGIRNLIGNALLLFTPRFSEVTVLTGINPSRFNGFLVETVETVSAT